MSLSAKNWSSRRGEVGEGRWEVRGGWGPGEREDCRRQVGWLGHGSYGWFGGRRGGEMEGGVWRFGSMYREWSVAIDEERDRVGVCIGGVGLSPLSIRAWRRRDPRLCHFPQNLPSRNPSTKKDTGCLLVTEVVLVRQTLEERSLDLHCGESSLRYIQIPLLSSRNDSVS